MRCYRCGKEVDSPKEDCSLKGVEVTVSLEGKQRTPENIEYFNKQLGKYSDGKGGCHVAICYECYIDNLFSGYPVFQHSPVTEDKG